jgi:membrane protein
MAFLQVKNPANKLKQIWKRHAPGEFLKYYLGGLYARGDAHNIFFMAGGLSFAILVCIVPLVLIAFSIAGLVLEKAFIAGEVNAFIERIVPYEKYAHFVKELIFTRVREFRLYKNLAGGLGLVGLFLASSSLFGSMRTILNKIYPADAGASVLINKLRDFGLVLLVLVFFLLSTTVLPIIQVVESLADKVEFLSRFRFDFLKDLVIDASAFLIILLALFMLYFLVPNTRPPKKVALVSAFSTATLWHLAKELFGFYIANAVNLKKIYGAYILWIVVVLWIYYSSIVFILGAEIGQLYRERKKSPR